MLLSVYRKLIGQKDYVGLSAGTRGGRDVVDLQTMNGKNSGELTSRDAGSIAQSDADDDGERVDRMQAQMGRRKFMATTAGTAAAVVAGSGVATAASASDINFSSDVVQAPRVEFDVTVAENTQNMSSALEYINDSGEEVSLANDGASLQDRPDPDTVHNPVSLRADKFAAYEYREFPRGETYDEDGDGSADADLNAVDAQHWTKDAAATTGTVTLETVTAANGENALRFAVSGQASGDVAKATFTDVNITSGISRKYKQLVANVDALASGAVFYVRAKDSAGTVLESVIDSAADSTAVGTIATATGSGQVHQAQLGEYSTSLDDIVELELAITDADADVTFPAINLDRESRWEFGTQEYLNADDEVDTQTLVEPNGSFSITDLGTLPDVFVNGGIMDVGAAIEFRAEDLQTSMRRARWGDASPYDFPHRLETLVGLKPPTAYDLSYANGKAVDEVLFPDTRYNTVKFARTSELPSWSDVDDEKVTWAADKTSTFESGSIGSDVVVTSTVNSDEMLVIYDDVLLDDSQKDQATAASGGGGGGPVGSSGGFLGSPMSIVLTVLGTVGAYFAAAKGMIPGMGN